MSFSLGSVGEVRPQPCVFFKDEDQFHSGAKRGALRVYVTLLEKGKDLDAIAVFMQKLNLIQYLPPCEKAVMNQCLKNKT